MNPTPTQALIDYLTAYQENPDTAKLDLSGWSNDQLWQMMSLTEKLTDVIQKEWEKKSHAL